MEEQKRRELNKLQGMRAVDGGTPLEPESEADHFYRCAACGQSVDRRRMGDVLHHGEPGHGQLGGDA